MQTKKPVIGIILDYQETPTSQGGYSDMPWHALRIDYERTLANHGALPIYIPYQTKLIDDYLKLCDGIISPGGDNDIPPTYYGEEVSVKNITILTTDRIDFELKFMPKILAANIPFLGICAGMQVLNVAQGGSLYQDIKEQTDSFITHRNDAKQFANKHMVDITPATKLAQLTGKTKFEVNSHHHQAVKTLGKDLVVSAIAPDNIIEAIEHPGQDFCLGVEWHPEYEQTAEDSKIFAKFVETARNRK